MNKSYEHVHGLVLDKNIHKHLQLKESVLNAQIEELTTTLDTCELFDEKRKASWVKMKNNMHRSIMRGYLLDKTTQGIE